MRISDWSSDVCSSDLFGLDRLRLCGGQGFDVYRVGDCGSFQRFQRRDFLGRCRDHQFSAAAIRDAAGFAEVVELPTTFDTEAVLECARRSAARRLGKGCGSKFRSGSTTYHEKK